MIVEHEEDEIQWECSTSIYTDAGEPQTLKEAMKRPTGNLCKMLEIYEVNNFMSRKAWITMKKIIEKE